MRACRLSGLRDVRGPERRPDQLPFNSGGTSAVDGILTPSIVGATAQSGRLVEGLYTAYYPCFYQKGTIPLDDPVSDLKLKRNMPNL